MDELVEVYKIAKILTEPCSEEVFNFHMLELKDSVDKIASYKLTF